MTVNLPILTPKTEFQLMKEGWPERCVGSFRFDLNSILHKNYDEERSQLAGARWYNFYTYINNDFAKDNPEDKTMWCGSVMMQIKTLDPDQPYGSINDGHWNSLSSARTNHHTVWNPEKQRYSISFEVG